MSPVVRKLNRLLTIHVRSFATYQLEATPWSSGRSGDEAIARTLRDIGRDRKALADRIYTAIQDRRGAVAPGSFPMEFTDKHDLSLEWLLRELLAYQRRDTAAIEQVARTLTDDPEAAELAQEALGTAQAHLEALESLAAKQPA